MANLSARRQLKKTAKHSAIYAIGTILRRITGLVMLPIYTRYLTPEDYGVVELLAMAIEITGILVGLRISQAMFRYYILADDEEEKRRVVSTVLLTVSCSSIAGAILLWMLAESLSAFIFGDTRYVFELRLFALTLVTNALTGVGLSFIRARQMPIVFVSIGAVMLALQVALNIIFVVKLEMHVTGVVISAVISGSILSLGLSMYVLSHVGLTFSRRIAVELIKYISPLVVASLGAFYVSYADKYFLRLFGSLTDVGLYALAARVSSVLFTAFEAFHMTWSADRFEIVKRDNAREIFRHVFNYMSGIVFIMGTALAVFARDFFYILTDEAFYPAASVVPLLISAVIIRIYMIFCNFGALYRDNTKIMAVASWFKAVVATAGYFVLIPSLGFLGAAIALALASLVELVWVHVQSSKLYDMELKWRPVFLMSVVAAVCALVGILLPHGEPSYILIRSLMMAGFILAVYLLPIWSPEEREVIRSSIVKLFGYVRFRAS